MTLFDDFVSLIFPRVCTACGKLLFKNEEIICTKCMYKLPKTNFHRFTDNPVMQIFWGRVQIHSAAAFLNFTKSGRVQRLIHQMKYKGKAEVGVFIGELYGKDLKNAALFQSVDVVIPVPLHWKKLKKRGFNQSEMFGRGLVKSMGVVLDNQSLIRKVDTPTQTKKTREQRWENVRDVFEVSHALHLEGKHILLVDDVITTGATLEASAATLMAVPGVKVSVATIAFATK